MTIVRAISVDLDGTLYPVRRLRVLWRLRWERGLLVAFMAAREKLRHESPSASAEELLKREAALVAPSFGLTEEEAFQRLQKLRAALPEAMTRRVAPFPGVRSALLAAHVRGLRIAVLSDFDPLEKLRWLGLDDLPWAATLGAEAVGALKPHRIAFERLAAVLEVEPRSIVHVGDREDLDVEGALGAGFRAWRFVRGRAASTRAEHAFKSWGIGLFSSLLDVDSRPGSTE